MPWQRLVADVAGEIDPTTGRLAYREIRLTVPRQSGKTTLGLAVMVDRALGFGDRQKIVSTAQSGKDARLKFTDDFLPVLKASSFWPHLHVRLTNGSEAVKFANGSMWNITAPTETAGHGQTIDLGFIDEAFSQQDARVEQALSPAMITRPQPQLWIVSTAGTPDRSTYLWGKVESGRAAVEADLDAGVAYFEWSAPDDADPGDPETWRSCMPAYGFGYVDEPAVRAEFLTKSTSEFRRAYLNQWVRTAHDQVIPPESWDAAVDTRAVAEADRCFAFDVSPDQQSAAIAVCGVSPRDGVPTVEVVDARSGSSWVADRLAELVDRWGPRLVVADFGGPAGAIKADVEARGVAVRNVTAREHSQAAGALYAAAVASPAPLIHHRNQPVLNAALGGASRRQLADAWAWSRKASSVDISPLVAVTLAHWAHSQSSPVVDVAMNVW